MYDLGVWLRQTYNTNGFLEFYNPSLHRLDSSNLDRTLTSANSLSLGLFPLNAQAGGNGAGIVIAVVATTTRMCNRNAWNPELHINN